MRLFSIGSWYVALKYIGDQSKRKMIHREFLCAVNGEVVSNISRGLMVLVGIGEGSAWFLPLIILDPPISTVLLGGR